MHHLRHVQTQELLNHYPLPTVVLMGAQELLNCPLLGRKDTWHLVIQSCKWKFKATTIYTHTIFLNVTLWVFQRWQYPTLPVRVTTLSSRIVIALCSYKIMK